MMSEARMSHSVTITRTTTTSSGNTLFINSGYLKTLPGFLKLLELALGAACVGVIASYPTYYTDDLHKAHLFYFLMSVAFLIGTFCILTSCLISLSSSTLLSKSIFEVIYHGLAFALYLAAGLALLIEVNHRNRSNYYEPLLAASIMGLVMAVLYLISTFLASRSYRGL